MAPFRPFVQWSRNGGNRWLANAQGRHEADTKKIGDVGALSGDLQTEYPYWRLVADLRMSPRDLDEWDLEEIDKANAMLDMREDYKSAYHEMSDHQMRAKQESK